MGPICGGQGQTKGREGCSRLVGGRFHKQGNLHRRLVLGGLKMSRSPYFLQNLYMEALTGFSHRYVQMVSIPHQYLKAVSLG